ncbi:hypothetical protein FOA43_002507 [Brettanomyces nanus]|uniref:Uncharacterized protein n=1 Tax=Eeniella nana TaxID=13502 RepID=A0A875S536_EENNA|nr:uncharacterized protein FOA43_002507 [Brettanomyces nanus]QPG75162.1 hypothetical protein FOA43_002507 [Brettanomyces nanus]
MWVQLLSPPEDHITSLNLSASNSDSPGLYITSFKGRIAHYNELSETSKPASVVDGFYDCALDSCLINGTAEKLVVGSLTGQIYSIDPVKRVLQQNSSFVHESGVQCLVYNSYRKLVLSGSWDHSGWLLPEGSQGGIQLHFKEKVQAMDSIDNYAVYALSTGQNVVYDLRKVDQPVKEDDSTFKYPLTTCICMIPGCKGYTQGSMEGKVSVETFNQDVQVPSSKYTFKCHRTVLADDVEFVGPINDIVFHDSTRFFTGGSNVDRRVCMWDYLTKKRVKQYKNLPLGVSKMCYDSQSGLLVVAMSDDSFKNSVSIDDKTFSSKSSIVTIIKT